MGARRPSRADAKAVAGAATRAHGRWFLALRPPRAHAARLADLARALAERAGGRALAASDLHLTLAFVGACTVEQLPALARALQRAALPDATALSIDVLGTFDGRLLWAGPSNVPAWLTEAAHAVRAGLRESGVPFDERPLHAHVTLTRGGPRIARETLRGWGEELAAHLPARPTRPWRLALGASGLPDTPTGVRYRWL